MTELVNKGKGVSEQEPGFNFEKSDFEEEVDSTILVRERVRGSKLEPVFQKKRGKILDESEHTLTFLPEGKKKPTKWSKRDIVKSYTLQPETQEVQKTARKKLRKGDISN